MSIIAIIIGILIIAIAGGMYFWLPDAFDGGDGLLWVVFGFFVVYGIAAALVSLTLNPFKV